MNFIHGRIEVVEHKTVGVALLGNAILKFEVILPCGPLLSKRYPILIP